MNDNNDSATRLLEITAQLIEALEEINRSLKAIDSTLADRLANLNRGTHTHTHQWLITFN
jgi:hypothetical protein